jgi:hypothetical protein
MSATDLTTLITDSQAVASLQAAAAEHCSTIFGCHARQKAVLSAARNAFGLPCSFGHRYQPHTIQRRYAHQSGIPHFLSYATAAQRAAQHLTGAAMPRRSSQLYPLWKQHVKNLTHHRVAATCAGWRRADGEGDDLPYHRHPPGDDGVRCDAIRRTLTSNPRWLHSR